MNDGDRRPRLADLRVALYAAAPTLVAALAAAARLASRQRLTGYLRWRTCGDFIADAASWACGLAVVALLQTLLLIFVLRRRRRVRLTLAAGWLLAAAGFFSLPRVVHLLAGRALPEELPVFAGDPASLAALFQKNLDNMLLPDRLWSAFAALPGLWIMTFLTPLLLGLAAYALLLHWPLRRWSAAEPSATRRARLATWLAPAALIAAIAALPRAGAALLRPSAAGLPDLILVSIDTLRQDAVGAYGGGTSVTRNIDRLAAQGARLTGLRAPCSWTVPSHAAMLTGRWPWSLGMYRVADALPPEANTLAAALSSRGYDAFAVVTHLFVDAPYGFGKGFSRVTRPATERAPAAVAAARAWLAARPADRPAFLFLHLYDAHWPYRPPPDVPAWVFRGSTPADRDEVGRQADAYAMALALRLGAPSLTAAARALYRGAAWSIDRELGELFDQVAARGRPTYIVVVADHGELFGEHDDYGHGVSLYEEELKVPCVVCGPGVPAGVALPGPASIADLAPTALDLLGLPGLLPDADGRSVADAIRRGAPLPPRWLAGENRSVGDEPVRYVSDGVWKWFSGVNVKIRGIAVTRPEAAFRLDADPREAVNRLGDPAAPDFPAVAADLFRTAAPFRRPTTLSPAERARVQSLGYLQ